MKRILAFFLCMLLLLSGCADGLLPGFSAFLIWRLTAVAYSFFSRELSSGLSLESQTTIGVSGLLPSYASSEITALSVP